MINLLGNSTNNDFNHLAKENFRPNFLIRKFNGQYLLLFVVSGSVSIEFRKYALQLQLQQQ